MRWLCPAGREAGSKCPRLSRITLRITGPGRLMFHSRKLASPAPVHAMVIRRFVVRNWAVGMDCRFHETALRSRPRSGWGIERVGTTHESFQPLGRQGYQKQHSQWTVEMEHWERDRSKRVQQRRTIQRCRRPIPECIGRESVCARPISRPRGAIRVRSPKPLRP